MESEEKLAAAGLGNSLMNVCQTAILISFQGSYNTIANQSYGKGNFHNVGYALQCAILMVVLVGIPLTTAFAFGGHILQLLGQVDKLVFVDS